MLSVEKRDKMFWIVLIVCAVLLLLNKYCPTVMQLLGKALSACLAIGVALVAIILNVRIHR